MNKLATKYIGSERIQFAISEREVIVAPANSKDGRLRSIVRALWERVRPHIPSFINGNLPPWKADRRKAGALRLDIHERCAPFSKGGFYYLMGKRLFDILVASIALLVLTIPMLVIAVAIRFESEGPATFRQVRTGQFGRRFAMYKFRTMVMNAEDLKASLVEHNVHGGSSPDFKMVNDPRITRLGIFLRKTSLDELPNFINVLLGNMSLVGPRPTSFESSTYGVEHLPRLTVKPGITGLWQVSGRANVGFDERAVLDVAYIENLSLRSDVDLMVRTLVSKDDGAY